MSSCNEIDLSITKLHDEKKKVKGLIIYQIHKSQLTDWDFSLIFSRYVENIFLLRSNSKKNDPLSCTYFEPQHNHLSYHRTR